jgi:phosphoglycerate dehydrogenase-like enzyme
MVLVRFNSNPTLKGHKLYVAIPINVWPTPQERIDSIRQRFPDLEIIFHEGEGAEVLKLISDEEWKDVTILVSWIHLPTIEQAPRLSYVQLISAGANAILNDPLYKDTEITFCTANGVHG